MARMPAGVECREAVIVEALRAQRAGLTADIEAVHHQQVEGFVMLRDPVRTVRAQDFQSFVIGGNAEAVAQRDDLGRYLGHRDPRPRQMVVTVLDERAATQTNHADARRFRHEQQRAHHDARVIEQQFQRSRRVHAALHRGAVEMHREHAVAFMHERLPGGAAGPRRIRVVAGHAGARRQ
jgi:hypothetical protein